MYQKELCLADASIFQDFCAFIFYSCSAAQAELRNEKKKCYVQHVRHDKGRHASVHTPIGSPVVLAMANKLRPKGGVTMPISISLTTMTPNHIGL
jgi:hypothetical protein